MQLVNILVQGVLLGGLYVIYGMGLSLIFGVMRLVNLAHGDLIGLAGYVALVVVTYLGLHPLVSLLVVIPVMFVVGFVLQRVILDRALGKGVMPPLLVTFGLSIIVQNGLLLGFTANSRHLNVGALATRSLHFNDELSIGVMPLITFVAALVLLVGLQVFFSRTRLGQAFRATSDDATTAQLMGINSRQIYALAMGLSLAVVAVGGVFLGIRTNFAPSDGPSRLIFAFETVIIGGLGSLWGTLAGGMILGVAQTLGAQLDPTWFQLSGHVVTLLVLALRPTGLIARTRSE